MYAWKIDFFPFWNCFINVLFVWLFIAMAGNIIPAIATTNAITAGLVVMRAFNVLQENFESCQSVYVRLRLNPRNQIIVPDSGK